MIIMIKKLTITFIFFIFLNINVMAQNIMPYTFWEEKTQEEKISFINGAYGAISVLKKHHKQEVKKQYIHKKNWVEPYYIQRFYDIADEYRSDEVGYNLKIIAMHMDALYANSDNYKLPIMEALRIVSLMQDGDNKRANLILLRAQKKYNNR
tara:strand:- start:197 stop:652 length:456 start_codon:yes stop_codon:yes gene_type:complete